MIALIGIILLIGIVKKNAILMIDFAIQAERNENNSPEESIYQACLLRFRPIMMTTMAAMFGGIPIAISNGNGAELRRPLGIAIVGGLIVSQMLTLYTTPVIYLYMDRLRAMDQRRKDACSGRHPAQDFLLRRLTCSSFGRCISSPVQSPAQSLVQSLVQSIRLAQPQAARSLTPLP